jgi:hypothetical protein
VTAFDQIAKCVFLNCKGWYNEQSVIIDLNGHFDYCTLTKRECQQFIKQPGFIWGEEYFQPKSCIEKCRYFQRVKSLIEKALSSRPYDKKLTQQDKDYLVYAFKKTVTSGFGSPFFHDLQRISARLLVAECRANAACPCKPLLPEYTVE